MKLHLIIGAGCLIALASCRSKGDHPGYIYFQDMTYSRAYETYAFNPNFEDSMPHLAPVHGTIPYGKHVDRPDLYVPFYFTQSEAEFERAGRELKNPVPVSPAALKRGEENYMIYCAVCHGESGKGDGPITSKPSQQYAAPTNYFKEDIVNMPDGKLFYSIHFGKNLGMGSYASQLSREERWEIVHFIRQLQQAEAGGDAETASTEEGTEG